HAVVRGEKAAPIGEHDRHHAICKRHSAQLLRLHGRAHDGGTFALLVATEQQGAVAFHHGALVAITDGYRSVPHEPIALDAKDVRLVAHAVGHERIGSDADEVVRRVEL